MLAEEHRTILVEQLHDIVNQLASNPDQVTHFIVYRCTGVETSSV